MGLKETKNQLLQQLESAANRGCQIEAMATELDDGLPGLRTGNYASQGSVGGVGTMGTTQEVQSYRDC